MRDRSQHFLYNMIPGGKLQDISDCSKTIADILLLTAYGTQRVSLIKGLETFLFEWFSRNTIQKRQQQLIPSHLYDF